MEGEVLGGRMLRGDYGYDVSSLLIACTLTHDFYSLYVLFWRVCVPTLLWTRHGAALYICVQVGLTKTSRQR